MRFGVEDCSAEAAMGSAKLRKKLPVADAISALVVLPRG
jgi:hypothetical protein